MGVSDIMKRFQMKKKLLYVCSVLLIFSASEANAQVYEIPTPSVQQTEYTLPFPGILPDHPLYFLKAFRDQTMEIFTPDVVKKSNLNLLFSDKHIVMGQLLIDKKNYDLGIETISKGEKYLLASVIGLKKLKNKDSIPPGLLDKIKISGKKHKEIITNLADVISDEPKNIKLKESLEINNQTIEQIDLLK